MSEALKINRTLLLLDLSSKSNMDTEKERKKNQTGNCIGGSGATVIGESLKSNSTLSCLILRCANNRQKEIKKYTNYY